MARTRTDGIHRKLLCWSYRQLPRLLQLKDVHLLGRGSFARRLRWLLGCIFASLRAVSPESGGELPS